MCREKEMKNVLQELTEIIRESFELRDYDTYSFLEILEELVKLGHTGKLINFINSIGEQDANNSN
jgi:ferritin